MAVPAAGQIPQRPADERLEVPPFETDEPDRPSVEPPILPPVPQPKAGEALESGLEVQVRAYRIVGSTVFTEEELERVTEPWAGRTIDAAQLQDVVDAVTMLYVGRGFVSSGAFVPDQVIEDDIVTIQVIEAELTRVTVRGNRWYREVFFRRRIEAEMSTPVNIVDAERAVQLLLQEPGIRRVAAQLQPGLARGETVVALEVEERLPLGATARVANDRPPGIGSVAGTGILDWWSVLGIGDTFHFEFEFTGGANAQDLRYELPVTGHGTTLLARYRRADIDVVEEPFARANITSDAQTVSLAVRHPLIFEPDRQLWLGLRGEWRESETFLLGRPFSFELGPQDGRAVISVIRLDQEYFQRSRKNSIAARSTFSFGIDALGSTVNPGDVPDSRYFAWLAQGQWAHRLPPHLGNSEILARADLQVTPDSLLSLERFAVGGLRTVRGYRENLLVRDNGVVGSLEIRIPLVRNLFLDDVLQLAPFLDVGYGWNVRDTPPLRTLASLGLGLRYLVSDRLGAEVYWGGQLIPVERLGNTLQDYGVYFVVRLRAL